MQQEFYQVADHLTSLLRGSEVLTCSFSGEISDFVRFNKSLMRQSGRVVQRYLTLELIDGARHTNGTLTLAGDPGGDRAAATRLLESLRRRLPELPEDPHLLYSTEVRSSEKHQENSLPNPEDAIAAILKAGEGSDLVGIYAAGGIHNGFANSLGQKNWYSTHSFNFDWSFYHTGDKAVKTSYAGFEWDPSAFKAKVNEAREQLRMIAHPSKTIQPGEYRVYLSPVAMESILGMLGWGGFGLKSCKTRQSPLLKLYEEIEQLSPSVSIRENIGAGVAPDFQSEGFIRPPVVELISGGRGTGHLVSPRSAKEYGDPTNGANAWEMPESIEMLPGEMPNEEILQRLGTGVWISNLWYLNYSDRPAGRITGMTRFATLWVENGVIQSPLNVMRFDETVYNLLGPNLVALTSETEMLLDSSTYQARATTSARTPGALIEKFPFTL